jgi:GT2 family glycosyltransferase
MNKLKVVSIVANYKNSEETNRFIEKFKFEGDGIDLSFIVVDNSLDFKLHDSLADFMEFGGVQILKPRVNLGYYGAARYAFDTILFNKIPDWIIVSNSDVSPCDEINIFYQNLSKYDVSLPVVISPMILQSGTTIEWQAHMFKKMPRLRYRIKRLIYNNIFLIYFYELYALLKRRIWHRFSFRLIGNKTIQFKNIANEPIPIYSPAGAFTFFSKGFFLSGGTFDYKSFMYGEEIFIAEQSLKIGAKVFYDENIKIIHDGYSTTNFLKNPAVLKYKKDSINYIFDTYF